MTNEQLYRTATPGLNYTLTLTNRTEYGLLLGPSPSGNIRLMTDEGVVQIPASTIKKVSRGEMLDPIKTAMLAECTLLYVQAQTQLSA